jgi:hypothetical protein
MKMDSGKQFDFLHFKGWQKQAYCILAIISKKLCRGKTGKKKRKCHLIFSISGVRTHHNDLKWSRFQKKTLDYHQTFKKGGN